MARELCLNKAIPKKRKKALCNGKCLHDKIYYN